MTPKTITRTTRIHVIPDGESTISRRAISVEVEEEWEGSGEYVTVNDMTTHHGRIGIDPHEWPALRDAIDQLVAGCRSSQGEPKHNETTPPGDE